MEYSRFCNYDSFSNLGSIIYDWGAKFSESNSNLKNYTAFEAGNEKFIPPDCSYIIATHATKDCQTSDTDRFLSIFDSDHSDLAILWIVSPMSYGALEFGNTLKKQTDQKQMGLYKLWGRVDQTGYEF